MGNLWTNAFAYADGIVLLSPTCMALRCLVNLWEEFAYEYLLSLLLTNTSLRGSSGSNWPFSGYCRFRPQKVCRIDRA